MLLRWIILSAFLYATASAFSIDTVYYFELASITEHPYQCSVMYFGVYMCGCVIISDRYVLTSAFCTQNTAFGLFVRVGSSERSSGGVVHAVSAVHDHPYYDKWTNDYDLSVITLKKPIAFNERTAAIALVDEDFQVPDGRDVLFTGWGEGNSLHRYHLHSGNWGKCREMLRKLFTEQMICAGFGESQNIINVEDAGCPLVYNDKLVGIFSWNFGNVEPKYPSVYTNVALMRQFIQNITDI